MPPSSRSATKRATSASETTSLSVPTPANKSSSTGEFAALLEQSFGKSGSLEGTVVKGIIRTIEKEFAIIDVGLKSEGRVALREFALPGQHTGT